MKCAKRLASLLLVLVLSLAMLTVPAGATPGGTATTGTITIDKAYVGETYKIYQIFTLESYDAVAGTYAYKIDTNSPWMNFLTNSGAGADYVNIDGQGYVTWKDGKKTDAYYAAFAKAALLYAQTTDTITATETKKAEGTGTTTTVKFTGLALGYYLVDSSLGTLAILDSTTPDFTKTEKNEVPAVDKEVREDSDSSYGDSDDADIGDTVTFQTTITVKGGARNFVLHDKMSEGLTFGDVTRVQYRVATGVASGSQYEYGGWQDLESANYTDLTVSDGCTFEIAFQQSFLNGLNTGDQIQVTYTATVNSSAVVGSVGNSNETWLAFGDDHETTADETKTYTWGFSVLKYGNGNEGNRLAGAKFVLLRSNSGEKDEVATIVNGKLTGWEAVPTADQNGAINWSQNTVQTTDDNGNITIQGLDSGTYYLRETAAPQGYNLLAGDVTVVIAENGSVTLENGSEGTVAAGTNTIEIENKSGTILPSTGGVGTTLLYAAGTILALGAALILIIRRRMRAEEE